MAQVRILSLCLLLLLGSPISLEWYDGIFVDSRLNLGLGHARNGKSVCEVNRKSRIHGGRTYMCRSSSLLVFLNTSWQ